MRKRALLLAALCACSLPFGGTSSAATVTVGIVTDGPLEREMLPVELLRTEGEAVLGGDPQLEFPQALRLQGGWTLGGINRALDTLLANPDVDVIVTLGLLSSNQASRRPRLAKPVIAPFVADPVLEGYPLVDGHSGRRNFAYVADFVGVEEQITLFHRCIPFKHLVALVDQLTLEAIPDIARKADQVAAKLPGVRITIVPVGDSVDAALAQLPADADAVFVTPLTRLSTVEFRQLASGLTSRRLPTFTSLGRPEVEAGMLMASSGSAADLQRLARRIVLDIQRIQEGEDAGTLEVGFSLQRRLLLNMRTARALNYSPRWADLTDAELIDAETAEGAEPLSMLSAMRAALESNPALAAGRLDVDIAGDDLRSARSNLLPQVDLAADGTRIDADRASPLIQSEKQVTGSVRVTQLVYSEQAWAGYTISRHLASAADAGYRASMLDTLQSAANAYLDLLRAQSVESVRRSNVDNTRRNLETSRVREAVGLAERSDYLRWVSQLARDRSTLLEAEANRQQAETALSRVLHRPASQRFVTVEAGLEDPMAFVADPRTQAYVDTPAKWAIFMEHSVSTARQRAPEIRQIDAQIAAQNRSLSAARRAFYLPDFALVSEGADAFQRSGAGSQNIPGGPDTESWNITLQASIPVFTGGARRAELSRARHGVQQLSAQRDAIVDSVDARARAALQRIASSYPTIELARTAADASRENLSMVGDAYSRGIVSVTELIDAQEADLSSQLAAAQARYNFLGDFIDMLRATGSFEVLLDPASRTAWYDEVDAWFRQHSGANPP
jgi:outer membrane protein